VTVPLARRLEVAKQALELMNHFRLASLTMRKQLLFGAGAQFGNNADYCIAWWRIHRL
jgi:hypothetical protein